MPREGVPYPGREICSLKCQIDALNAKINELMKSINGVQGDGQGNLTLVSGDPAIVINNDQAQHEIEIALDASQLPAAAVSSVNGQTGAIVLEADDIASDGNSDVQADIDALKALGTNLQGAISNEVTARGNADAALQGNINAVSAGLPAAAAAAVAADPTVAQLAVDVPNKLDKITSGSSLKAYTHTGATQGEKSVVDGTTADSIAIRDADGRLQAADPASGATDKTLVTSNWVSQTGNNSPNNLVHRSGNEDIAGLKTFVYEIVGKFRYNWYFSTGSNGGKWVKICSFPSNTLRYFLRLISRYDAITLTGSNADLFTKTNSITLGASAEFTLVTETDGTYTLWFKLGSNWNAYYALDLHAWRYGSEVLFTISTDTNVYAAPTPGASSITSQEMAQ